MKNPLAPIRRRHDGWTPARQRAFIQALSDSGSVTAAADHAGMTASAAYRLRRHPAAGDFRAAWDAALAEGWRRVEETAMARAIHGETETIERDGEIVTRHRPCSPRLLTSMLDRAAAFRAAEKAAAEAKARPDPRKILRAQQEIAALATGAELPPWEPDEDDVRVKGPVVDPEAAALERLHSLSQGFVDRPGWEGPAAMPGDGCVPVLPIPETRLKPASILLAGTAGGPRLHDPAAPAGMPPPPGKVQKRELRELPGGRR